MSDAEMNKKMEFIVEHQAKFAAEMEIMRETQAEESTLRNEQYRRISDGLLSVLDIVGSLTRAQIRTDEKVNSLSDLVERLAQAQMSSDERLNSLISVVERHIAGNGGSASPS